MPPLEDLGNGAPTSHGTHLSRSSSLRAREVCKDPAVTQQVLWAGQVRAAGFAHVCGSVSEYDENSH